MSQWHKFSEGMPEMKEEHEGYKCSELVLYRRKSWHGFSYDIAKVEQWEGEEIELSNNSECIKIRDFHLGEWCKIPD